MILKNKDNQYYNRQNGRSGMDKNNNLLDRFVTTINFQKNKNDVYIIDIGCRGNASMVRKLISLGFTNTFGIDIGENAEKQWDKYLFKDKLKRADVHESIPFEYKFDLVSCSHTLEHCYNPSLVFDNIKKSLIDGGFYWGQVPTSKAEDVNNHAPHYCYFDSHHDHVSFIESKGFEIVKSINDSEQSLVLAKMI